MMIPNLYMGVPKNRGTPKWMVYNGKPYEQMDDLGGKNPYFWKHPSTKGKYRINLLPQLKLVNW